MSGRYKLVIQNKNKILLNEGIMQYHFKQDILPVFQDILKTSTNVVKATIISVGASVEYQIIAADIRGFASLKGINKKFEEKITEANKLYKEAVPESVRGDVELLFGMANPSVIMSQRLADSIANSKELDNYIPFWWFTKYLLDTKSGFFKNDVKDFGDLFGFKFNNIIWFKGWLYKDLIIDNVEWFRTTGFQLLQKTNIQSIQGLSYEQFEQKFAAVGLFMRSYKLFQSVTAPEIEYYNFCQQWGPDKLWNLMKDTMELETINKKLAGEYSDAAVGAAQADANNNPNDQAKQKAFTDLRDEQTRLKEQQSNLKLRNDTVYESFQNSVKYTLANVLKAEKEILGDTIKTFTGEEYYENNIENNMHRVFFIVGNIVNVPLGKLSAYINKTLGFNIDFRLPNSWTLFQNDRKDGKLILNNHTKTLVVIEEENQQSKNNGSMSALKSEVGAEKVKINPDVSNQITLDDIDELKQLGLTKYQPNRAEEIILKNLIDNKKINKYTEQWMELSKLSKNVSNKPLQVRKDLFCDMLVTSMKYFDMIQNDLNIGFENLKNDRSVESKKINSELQKNFNFEMTPQGFAQKISYDFELLCNINTIYAGSYLNNLKFMYEKNNLLYHFLRGDSFEDVKILIGSLRNNITNHQQLDLSDAAIKKLENMNKEIVKMFGEKSRTFEIFTNANNNLKESIASNKEFLLNFCNEIEKNITDIRNQSDFTRLETMNNLTFEFIKTLEINLKQIYNEFLPALKNLKSNFEENIGKRKEILKKDFDNLLVKMDLQSFDNIYKVNKVKFDKKYNECIQYIGQAQSGSKLDEYLNELQVKQQEYSKKLEELNNTEELTSSSVNKKSSQTVATNRQSQKDNNPVKEKINIETNSLNPVSVGDNSDDLETDVEGE